ncbi:hypothetical protein FRC01_011416, partial [Tulasnella sp. 417]
MLRIDSPAETTTEQEVDPKAAGGVGAEKHGEVTTVRRSHPKTHKLDTGDDSVVYRRR